MANTPYMDLLLPTPGVTPGPTWADSVIGLNFILTKIDSHNHTLSQGNPLPISALIPSNFDFTGFTIHNLFATSYKTSLVDPSYSNSIYSKLGELFFRDGAGNFVQITSGGAVISGTPGSITIDGSVISVPEFYYTDNGFPDDPVDYGSLQLWENHGTLVHAQLESADVIIYEQLLGIDKGVGLSSPSGVATTYFLTLPTIPLTPSLLTIDAIGVISPTRDLVLDTFIMNTSPTDKYVMMSNSTGTGTWQQIVAASIATDAVETLKIKNANVTAVKLATDAVETLKIKDANVTKAKLAALGQQLSASSGSYYKNYGVFTNVTNLTITITTTGRPIFLALQSDSSGNPLTIGVYQTSTPHNTYVRLLRTLGGVDTEVARFTMAAGYTGTYVFNQSFFHIDAPSANTYTYRVQAYSDAQSYNVSYAKLIAYEL